MNTKTHPILFTSNLMFKKPFSQELADISSHVIMCESTIIVDSPNHYIVHKKCEKMAGKETGKESGKETQGEVFLTMAKIDNSWTFIREYLYQDGIEIEIQDYVLYQSIQLGGWAYDSLGVCFFKVEV